MPKKLTQEEFIKRAKEIHGNKYDYSKTEYVNYGAKVRIICPEHGEFTQLASMHLCGHGCMKCAGQTKGENRKYSKDDFIKLAKKVHGDKYDYSKVDYINSQTKVCIICPEHGEFWQTPHEHLQGCGCPKCKQSKLENEIENIFKNSSIKYVSQKRFKWLGLQSLDFYLPEYNIAVECQGAQHYEAYDFFGGESSFKATVERDQRKAKLCEENGLKLLYFTHYPNIIEEGNIYKDKDKLLETINGYIKSK